MSNPKKPTEEEISEGLNALDQLALAVNGKKFVMAAFAPEMLPAQLEHGFWK